MKKLLILGGAAAMLLSSSLLAGCGRMGELEPPRARETERAPRDANAPSLTEPATINRQSSQLPIDGGPANPFGGTTAASGPQ